MWSRFRNFLRSLFRTAPLQSAGSRQDTSAFQVETPQETLKDLHRKRDQLRKTIASYRDFGYDDLARQCQEEMLDLNRRILEVRLTHHAYS